MKRKTHFENKNTPSIDFSQYGCFVKDFQVNDQYKEDGVGKKEMIVDELNKPWSRRISFTQSY